MRRMGLQYPPWLNCMSAARWHAWPCVELHSLCQDNILCRRKVDCGGFLLLRRHRSALFDLWSTIALSEVAYSLKR